MSMAACGVVLLAGAALDGPCGVSGKGGGVCAAWRVGRALTTVMTTCGWRETGASSCLTVCCCDVGRAPLCAV